MGDVDQLHRCLMLVLDSIDPNSVAPELVREGKVGYSLELLRKRAFGKSSFALGAFESRRLVAFLWGWSGREGVFMVDWMGVLPEHRRRGVGRALLARLEAYAKAQSGIYKITLFATASNLDTQKVYVSHGYRLEGVHPNHFFGYDFVSFGKIVQSRPKGRRELRRRSEPESGT